MTSTDGSLTLEFPAGAVSEDTTIAITSLTEEGVLGYTLEPDGIEFNELVTASLTTDLSSFEGQVDADGATIDLTNSGVYFPLFLVSTDGEVEISDTGGTSTDTLSGKTVATTTLSHFSKLVHHENLYTVTLTAVFDNEQTVGSTFEADPTHIRFLDRVDFRSSDRSTLFTTTTFTAKTLDVSATDPISVVRPSDGRFDLDETFGGNSLFKDISRPQFVCLETGLGVITLGLTGTITFDKTREGVELSPSQQEITVSLVVTVNCIESTSDDGDPVGNFSAVNGRTYEDDGSTSDSCGISGFSVDTSENTIKLENFGSFGDQTFTLEEDSTSTAIVTGIDVLDQDTKKCQISINPDAPDDIFLLCIRTGTLEIFCTSLFQAQ